MLYVSGCVLGRDDYFVTDTKDGVEELCSGDKLYELVKSGIDIKGVESVPNNIIAYTKKIITNQLARLQLTNKDYSNLDIEIVAYEDTDMMPRSAYSIGTPIGACIHNLEIPFGVHIISKLWVDGSLVAPVTVFAVKNDCSTGSAKLTSIIFKGRLKVVEGRAFGVCINLKDVKFAKGVDVIGSRAFNSCNNLTNVSGRIGDIQSSAFYNCGNLRSIDLSGTERIAETAFSFCTGLTDLDLSNCREIGERAFESCDNLRRIKFGKHLKTIHPLSFPRLNCTTVVISNQCKCKDVLCEMFSHCALQFTD